MRKLSWLPKITVFEFLALVTICAVMISANTSKRLVHLNLTVEGGLFEYAVYGWPFPMVGGRP